MNYYERDNYSSLITIPSNDGNFISALGYVTDDELARAKEYFENNPFHNSSRLAKVKSEINKRRKNNGKNH
jgi:hypothetical protein